MSAWTWYQSSLQKYAVFGGRARRAEYWYFTLVNLIIFLVLDLLGGGLNNRGTPTGLFGLAYGIYALAILIPSIAVSVRRLHDTNRSGWWALLYFVPIVGGLALLFLFAQEGTRGENAYGPDPKGVVASVMPGY